MFMLLLFLSFFLFFSGCVVFVSNLKHLLLMLMSLEFMVLSLFMYLLIYLNLFFLEQYFCMFYLVFTVCEGALGLSVLVSLIRSHGNDYFQSFSVLQC